MSSNIDSTIESMIVAKGLTAPRITPELIAKNIDGEYYYTAAQGVEAAIHEQDEITRQSGMHTELHLLTHCTLVLKNGFTVTGVSACASPENFKQEIGRKIAKDNAIAQIWPLMGYELRSKLAGGAA